MKSLQKIWSEKTQKRRPRGSSIKYGEIWPAKFGQMRLPQPFKYTSYICLNCKISFSPVYVNEMNLKWSYFNEY